MYAFVLTGYSNIIKVIPIDTTTPQIYYKTYSSANNKTKIYNIAYCRAKEYGNIQFDVNTITRIGTNQVAVDNILNSDIINFEESDNGRLDENDEDYRARFYDDNIYNGYGNLNKICQHLITDLSFVKDAFGFENITDATISEIVSLSPTVYDYFPPRTFEIVIDGADTVTNSSQIASKIWEYSGGNNTHGSKSITIVDSSGTQQIIKFSYVSDKAIYFKITLQTADLEKILPNNYAEIIRENILIEMNKIVIGKDIILGKFYKSVYSVDGIGTAKIEIGFLSDYSDCAVQNLVIFKRWKPFSDASKISVTKSF
jgi:hypothetical protein